METLPGAVQVVIEWAIYFFQSIIDYFKYLFGKGDKQESTSNE